MTQTARLGPALRELRKRKGWTLAEVAKRTGVSISTLSKTERGQLSLTYDKLVQLAQGLEVDITTFFDRNGASDAAMATTRRSVNRVEDGTVVETDNYQYRYLFTDLLRKKFVPIIAEIRARTLQDFGQMVRHAGEEFAYVLEGTVAIHTELYAPTILKAGESIYFDSRMAHAYVAQGSGPCRVLSICSAPESSMQEAVAQHVGSPAPVPRKPRKR
jgi:transcriptional regulator with XRE-family HTH domain